jgi:2'-5' RNA ligase
MQTESIRSFFACDFTQENLNEISRISAELKTKLPDLVRWVGTENIHLTIKFIGEFKPDDVERTRSLLIQEVNTLKQFEIQINRLGVFPSYSMPRIIWVGIDQNEQMLQLVKMINRSTEQMGYPTEKRPFSAHVTLGRVRNDVSADKLRAIGSLVKSNENCIIGSQYVREVCFFQSRLTPQGSIYTKLFTVPLSV